MDFEYNGQNMAGSLLFKQTYMKTTEKVSEIKLIRLFLCTINK
jgi:hypothetical protein